MSIKSAQSLYRSYCNVVARWPLDKSKTSRDLAVFIHDRVNLLFPNGDRTEINDQTRLKSIQDEIEALNRIVSDHHRLSVSMKNVSASSGLKLEELQSVNSTESLKQMKDIYAKGFIYNFTNDLKETFKKMFELLKNGPYVCIHCGYGGNRNVYKIYGDQINYHCRSPSSALDLDVQRSRSTTPRLTKCSKCFDFVDDYVQLDYNILYLDAILQRKTFYRHILLNCEILSKKLALKMALVFFFCDAFQRWTTYNGVTFTASKTDDGIHLDTSLSTLMIGLMSNIVSDQIIASIISPPISSSMSAKQISRNYFQLEISFYYNFLYTTIENIIFNILFFYNFCFFIWFFKQPIITKMISRFRIFYQKTATHLKTSQSEMNELTHYSESNLETDQSSSTSSTMNQYEMIKLCNFNELFMSLIICSYGKLFLIPSNLYGGDWKPILDLSIQIFYFTSLVQCLVVRSHSQLNHFQSILLILLTFYQKSFILNLNPRISSLIFPLMNKLQSFL